MLRNIRARSLNLESVLSSRDSCEELRYMYTERTGQWFQVKHAAVLSGVAAPPPPPPPPADPAWQVHIGNLVQAVWLEFPSASQSVRSRVARRLEESRASNHDASAENPGACDNESRRVCQLPQGRVLEASTAALYWCCCAHVFFWDVRFTLARH